MLVEEDLLPPGTIQHLDGQLRRPAGRHRSLKAAEAATGRELYMEGVSVAPDGVDSGDGEAEVQEVWQLLHVLVDVAAVVQEDVKSEGRCWLYALAKYPIF